MIASSPPHYAVIGHPIAHSRSPDIHARFAAQTGIALRYDTLLAPLDGFAATVHEFFAQGGAGLNVTVPFKEQACALAAPRLSARAQLAGAVNTLWMHEGGLHGCNTDGVGLLADLVRLGAAPAGRRILLVGAGGAARGVAYPLLEAGCTVLRIVNRSSGRAHALRGQLAQALPHYDHVLQAGGLDEAQGEWDVVVNATSGSLSGQVPALPGARYAPDSLAYDMMYAAQPTPFMSAALQAGASRSADGLGMLVGQAAASFSIWHGVQPEVEPVLAALRAGLRGS